MIRWVFWQNQISFHQSSALSSLAKLEGNEVVWVVQATVSQERIELGWAVPDVPDVEIVVDPNAKQISQIIHERESESIHFFGGIHGNPLVRRAFHACVGTNARIGYLTEPPIPGSILRNILIWPYHAIHRFIYGRRVCSIFAIGQTACSFYRSIGFSEKVVHRYGYWPQVASPPTFSEPRSNPFRLIYLGQLIKRKGVDFLLKAVALLKDLDWELTLMGSGIEENSLKQLAEVLQIADRVTFLPPASNLIALKTVANCDLFVLPSRHDGWGAVVNESLICGVPVLCSDHCGASDLLKDPWRGGTFKSESINDLADKLRIWINKGVRNEAENTRIRQWCSNITGESVAAYVNAAYKYSISGTTDMEARPLPPWLN